MFARVPNRLSDARVVSDDAKVASESSLTQRALDAASILYPSVAARAGTECSRAAKLHHAKRKVLEKDLPDGSTVMIKDVRWTRKQMEPRYLGPFEVVERKGNSYRLVDKATRKAIKRLVPIDQIKIVERPLLLPDPSAKDGDPDFPDPPKPTRDVQDDPLISFERSIPPADASDPTPPPPSKPAPAPKTAATHASGTLPDLYEVEDIVAMRTKSAGGGGGRRREFLIRWVGYPSQTDNTWEPEEHLPSHLVEAYLADQHRMVPASPQKRTRRKPR